MSYDVRVTPEAHEEIANHALWWAEHRSASESVAWFEAIYQQLATLAEMPERGPIARENAHISEEVRELQLGIGTTRTHRAIYWVNGEAVEVLSVRHLAQEAWLQKSPKS